VNDALRTLRLFNEKAEKLLGLRFTAALKKNVHVTHTYSATDYTVSRTGPGSEEIEAFVLTLRFFVQNNEPISVANVARLYEDLDVSDDLKMAVRQTRTKLNDFLDATAGTHWHAEKLTRRRILDVFLYGGLAHAQPEKKNIFDQWVADSRLFPEVEGEFIFICSGVLQAIVWMMSDNAKALAELGF
jgi:hypothetical protein